MSTITATSTVDAVRSVDFPVWTGESAYMVKFGPSGLPASFDRWSPVVESMLGGMKFRRAYLTVHESAVRAGAMQRRPGVHIDGNWCEGRHGERPPRHSDPIHSDAQLLFLASNVEGCAGYVGDFQIQDFSGGDCSSVDIDSLKRVRMLPGVSYVGDACGFVHESIPVEFDCLRTMVRLNVVP